MRLLPFYILFVSTTILAQTRTLSFDKWADLEFGKSTAKNIYQTLKCNGFVVTGINAFITTVKKCYRMTRTTITNDSLGLKFILQSKKDKPEKKETLTQITVSDSVLTFNNSIKVHRSTHADIKNIFSEPAKVSDEDGTKNYIYGDNDVIFRFKNDTLTIIDIFSKKIKNSK